MKIPSTATRVVLLGVMGACTPVANDASRAVADTAAVRSALDSLWTAIGRLDVASTLAAYDTAAGFAHVLDGELLRGRPAYDAFVRAAFPSLRAIKDTRIDSVHVLPVDPDHVVVIVSYHETVVDTAGTVTPERGIWSNLFVRRPDGWKVLFGHTTHVLLNETK